MFLLTIIIAAGTGFNFIVTGGAAAFAVTLLLPLWGFLYRTQLRRERWRASR